MNSIKSFSNKLESFEKFCICIYDEFIKKYPVIILPIMKCSFFLKKLFILIFEFFSFICLKENSDLNSSSLKLVIPLIIFFLISKI